MSELTNIKRSVGQMGLRTRILTLELWHLNHRVALLRGRDYAAAVRYADRFWPRV